MFNRIECRSLKNLIMLFKLNCCRFSLIILLFTYVCGALSAQNSSKTTDAFTINGMVVSEMKISMAEIAAMQAEDLPEMDLMDKNGKFKMRLTGLRGVPLLPIFSKIQYQVKNPKDLSLISLVFIPKSGPNAIYSWNEIYGNNTRENLFVITEKKGEQYTDTEEDILVIAPADKINGNRYIKNLQEIRVIYGE